MITFQEMIRRLSKYWEEQGCIIHQGYDLEVGAGTMNPATFLRCLGPEPYRAAYIEPCRRPADGRYGENPNRLQHYYQYQVILKPSPLNMQEMYIDSLKAMGIDLSKHDIRFVHDDWENPTIGAWGLGWEVWIDGMEITQYTYFQSVGGIPVKPVTGELTYGIERLGMYLQNVDSIFDLKWNEHLTYGDIYHRNEVEWSHYNFEEASTEMWLRHFNDYEKEARKLIEKNLPIPAYEFVMKASHSFNLLDARGAISVTERAKYIARIRDLAKLIADSFIKSREEAGFPLLKIFPVAEHKNTAPPPVPQKLLEADPSRKEDFLLEVGSEELPATFVPIGMRNLKKCFVQLLEKEGIPFDSIETFGTPRRLALIAKGLAMGLPEQQEERKGPSIEKAYGSDGQPTKAGEGFFRSLGRQPPSLEDVKKGKTPGLSVKEIKGSEYLFAVVHTEGRSTAETLSRHLGDLILNLDFPKKMRWADLDIAYARPIRWIAALFGSEVVPFKVGELVSDRVSRGHSQLDPGELSIPSAEEYVKSLESRKVMVSPERRREAITSQLDDLENALDARIIERDSVLPQVLNLVEWPQVTETDFDISFLKAPREVLISEMVEHQKYFPVASRNGELVNRFVITSDTNPSDNIRHGNRKVLSSRLADGVFLYEKGLQEKLETLNKKLKDVTFLSGLGSLHDKVLRLMGHADVLQKFLKLSKHEKAVRAAQLSKADLVSEMVYEFPELQGTIGKYYALHQGEDPEVAQAIEEQWMPRGENDPLPESGAGTILSLAEKFDNLISCFSAGLRPTSSSDPHALRRQALGIIKILISGKLSLPFRETLEDCSRNFIPAHLRNRKQVVQDVEDFFINRVKTVFQDYGFSKDEIEASLVSGFRDIYDTFCKVQALQRFRESGDTFTRLFEVYKRARGQISDREALNLSEDLLSEEAETALNAKLNKVRDRLDAAIKQRDYDEAYDQIAQLQPGIARLFDEVRILADDPEVRDNRIALLQKVFGLFSRLLDFSKIKEKG